MKAIIPVAGIGKRLRPLTNNKPKVLIPVNNKLMLGHLLDRLKKEDISEYIFITGYKKEMVEEYIKKNYHDLNSRFIFQEEMKGTAHAIFLARDFINEEVLIIFGDTLFQGELNLDSNVDGVIMVNETREPERLGIVEIKGNYVIGMEEKPKKPKSNLAIIGIYYFNNYKLLFECIDELIKNDFKNNNEYQITDALKIMLDKNAKIKFGKVDRWLDCGTFESLRETERILKGN